MFFMILLLFVCISNETRDSDATSIILPVIIQFNASDTILAARRQTCDVTPRSQQHSNAMCRFVGTGPFHTLPAPFRTCLPLPACFISFIQQQSIIVAICHEIQHLQNSIRETHMIGQGLKWTPQYGERSRDTAEEPTNPHSQHPLLECQTASWRHITLTLRACWLMEHVCVPARALRAC